MRFKMVRALKSRLVPLAWFLGLFPASLTYAHSLTDTLVYMVAPIGLIVGIITPLIKWFALRRIMTELPCSRLIAIILLELFACASAFFVVGYWDFAERICHFWRYGSEPVSEMARMGVWALVWFSGNIPINFLAARSGKRSAEHTLAGRNRIFIAMILSGISPGIFWLFTVLSGQPI